MTHTISKAYAQGIVEGRSFLKSNPDLTIEEMQRLKENTHDLMKTHSDAMKELFKGERDFWVNQIKKGKTNE